jgi:general secretion pathway protein G
MRKAVSVVLVMTVVGFAIAMFLARSDCSTVFFPRARHARERALNENLFQMRKAIDNFYADRQRYPQALDELVPRYIRKVPADPVTQNGDWLEVRGEGGITDVKSRARGSTCHGVPYADL